jgi:hypothetical protein
MDLESLDVVSGANAGFDLQLTHPVSGNLLPLFVRILGADSDEYKKVDEEQNKKRLDNLWKGGQFRPLAQTPAHIDEQNIARLVAITRDWWEVLPDGTKRHTFELNKELIACSPPAVALMYKGHPWMREQIFIAVHDRANFIKGLSAA